MDSCVWQMNSHNVGGKDFCLFGCEVFLVSRAKLYKGKKCLMNI